MLDIKSLRLLPDQLRLTHDPATFEFECTEELAPLTEFVGQDRALRSLQFGLGLDKTGYNIFVTGLAGTGKATAILDYIQRTVEERRAAGELAMPEDWCYVYNFDDPDQPRALRLPRGTGRKLRAQLEELLSAARARISRAFASEEYEHQRLDVIEQGQREAQRLMDQAQKEAQKAGFALRFSPMGVVVVPLLNGQPMTADQFAALDADTRAQIQARQQPVTDAVEEVGERVRSLERETAERLHKLDSDVGNAALAGLFDGITALNRDYPGVVAFLQQLHAFSLANLELFRDREAPPSLPLSIAGAPQADPFLAFRCNVVVDNSEAAGPPIVIEPNPTWTNLFGRIERRAYLGTYVSDHTLLKPGSVHRANGGYIILNLLDLLVKPGVWDGLKRALRTKQVPLEDPMEQYGFFTPQALRPQPIPIDLKLVVTGDPIAYFLLSAHDEEFWEMFKVKADFDYQIPRTAQNALAYAGFICACCQRDGLRHFDRSAVAKVVEHGSRVVEDQEKLSARFGRLRDLIVEADYWAGQAGADLVSATHVERAIGEREYRLNLVEERIRELIQRGTIMLDVSGAVAGQVNGLSVLDFGDFAFGRPSRITARTFMGQRGVVSIDRESQLTGHIHDKGVLTLGGYLGWKYAQDKTLSLSASISFEQAYEPVEGDSASLAELCAILSSLADAPLRQDLAVTGSVNQKGEVQPVGGVNRKIEGFHDVCRAIGFTGEQGVILPARNRRSLMLREDVVESARQGRFHIYTVDSVDEAAQLLTGLDAGERGPDGRFPEDTINARVDNRLREMGEALRKLGRRDGPPTEPGAEPAANNDEQA